MLNHACLPNVSASFRGLQLQLHALEALPGSSTLRLSYGPQVSCLYLIAAFAYAEGACPSPHTFRTGLTNSKLESAADVHRHDQQSKIVEWVLDRLNNIFLWHRLGRVLQQCGSSNYQSSTISSAAARHVAEAPARTQMHTWWACAALPALGPSCPA